MASKVRTDQISPNSQSQIPKTTASQFILAVWLAISTDPTLSYPWAFRKARHSLEYMKACKQMAVVNTMSPISFKVHVQHTVQLGWHLVPISLGVRLIFEVLEFDQNSRQSLGVRLIHMCDLYLRNYGMFYKIYLVIERELHFVKFNK